MYLYAMALCILKKADENYLLCVQYWRKHVIFNLLYIILRV